MEPGIDEVSISGISKIIKVTQNDRKEYRIKPNDFSIETIDYSVLPGGNARIFKALIDNCGSQGIRNMVALSSALVLTCAEVTVDIESGYKEALEIITSGQMKKKFNEYSDFVNKLNNNRKV